MTFEEIVMKEKRRQVDLWGIQDHSPEKWFAILVEEFGEIAQAVNQELVDEIKLELVHAAAVAWTWYDQTNFGKSLGTDSFRNTDAILEELSEPEVLLPRMAKCIGLMGDAINEYRNSSSSFMSNATISVILESVLVEQLSLFFFHAYTWFANEVRMQGDPETKQGTLS